MTKPKTPNTSAHAVTRIVGLLGFELSREIVGRSKHCLRGWMNEDRTSCPTWRQAIALDAAFAAAGGEGAPLLEAYADQLEVTIARRTACHRALVAEIATVSREFGEAIEATVSLTQPGHSENGTRRALIEIDQAESALVRMRRRVTSFLTFGAGSAAGKTGGAQ